MKANSRRVLRWMVAASVSWHAGLGASLLAQQERRFDDMPATIAGSAGSGFPLFVAGDRTVLPSGDVDAKLFLGGDRAAIQNLLAKSPDEDGCVHVELLSGADREPPLAEDLTAILKATKNVVLGTIVGAATGFSGSQPGTLFRVVPDTKVKGAERLDEIYVFYPVGEVVVGNRRICHTNRAWAAIPEIGGHVLVLFQDQAVKAAENFVFTTPSDVIPLTADRLVQLPMRLKSSKPDHDRKPVEEFLKAAGYDKEVGP